MGNNLILPFAQGAGANVLDDPSWATSDVLAQGFQQGRAASIKYNKALRQSTAIASGFGQFTADYANATVSDSLSPQAIRNLFRQAVAASQASAYYAPDTSQVVNVIKIALDPVPVSFAGYMAFDFKAALTNTGNVSLAMNGNAAISLVRQGGQQLAANDIIAGQYYRARYDVASGRYIMATPVPSDMAGTGNATPIVQAAKAPFNLKQLQTTLRTSASAASAGTLVTVLSGLTYTKQSPTSTIIAWLTFQTYTTTQNGAVTMRFNVGSGFADAGLTNGFTPAGSSQPYSFGNSPIFFIPGLGAGAQNITLSFRRDDNGPWTTILNPTGSDVLGYPSPNTTNIIIAEVEP